MKMLLLSLCFYFLFFIGCRDVDDIIDNDDDNPPPPPPSTLDRGLIAYWNFDDGTARDMSGNGYHGIIINRPQPVPGVSGLALHFQGSANNNSNGDFIQIPMIDFGKYHGFSISMWVNEEKMEYFHGDAYIFFGDWTGGCLTICNHGIYPFTSSVEPLYLQFAVGLEENYANSAADGNPIRYLYNDRFRNNWIHYCMTFEYGEVKAYIDGNLIQSNRQALNIYGDKASIAGSSWNYGKSRVSRFTGRMDEIRIYDRVLYSDEILKLSLLSKNI